MDGKYPRLVHLPANLVGPPDSGVDLRGMQRVHRRTGNTLVLHPLRRQGPRAGNRRTGHLVQFRAVAVFHSRLAGSNRVLEKILSDVRVVHRVRHPVLLGGAHDHDGPQVHGRYPVSSRLHSCPDPRRRRPEDEQDQGQRHRPAGDDEPVRHRCAALHAGGVCHPGTRYQAGGGPHRRLPQFL